MLDVIELIILNNKTVVSKNENVLKRVIEAMCSVACDKDSKNSVDVDEMREAALTCINQTSNVLPKKKIYAIYKQQIAKYLESGEPVNMEAGFLILAQIAEGCAGFVRRDLEFIMGDYIKQGLQSTDDNVKKATYITISAFSHHLYPEMGEYSSVIMPAITEAISVIQDQKILERVLMALEIICEEMDDAIVEYLPTLLKKLSEIVNKTDNSVSIRRHALLALTGCVRTANEGYQPYAIDTAALAASFITLSGKLIH